MITDIIPMVKILHIFFNRSDAGFLEGQIASALTVRHKECKFIMSSYRTALSCPPCTHRRASLLIQHQRLQNSKENVQPLSAVNHRYLRTSELSVVFKMRIVW